jgi:hypothetical protein
MSDVMDMPAQHFFLLNRKIVILHREKEIRELSIIHNGKPGDRVKELVRELRSTGKTKVVTHTAFELLRHESGVATPIASAELDAIRERQRAAYEEQQKDPAAWKAKIIAQLAAEQQAKT